VTSAPRPDPGPDLLATIVAATRQAVRDRRRRCPETVLAPRVPAGLGGKARFEAALSAPGGANVIAECKRRSPSRGIIRRDYRPEAIAASYERNGAAAVSVLTEPTFFDGSLDHLRAVRAAVTVPVLRKDFIVTPYQLLEAAAAGADAVLLIAAALDDAELASLSARAAELGLGVLVEVHDADEMERAGRAGAAVIGVNNRNLRTLTVDVDASRRLVGQMPEGAVGVAESGLRTSADLVRLGAAGYPAFLIGESLMTAPDPGIALRDLLAGVAAAKAVPGAVAGTSAGRVR
jgi:indole-3-glycerol phosphate synthase